jgi:hypothetical protein
MEVYGRFSIGFWKFVKFVVFPFIPNLYPVSGKSSYIPNMSVTFLNIAKKPVESVHIKKLCINYNAFQMTNTTINFHMSST